MFREFGIDLNQRMSHIRTPQAAIREFQKLKEEAKKAFKRLAFEHHPDRNGGDDKEFKRLNSLWQVLEGLNPIFQNPRPQTMIRVVVNSGWGYPSDMTTTTSTSTTNW